MDIYMNFDNTVPTIIRRNARWLLRLMVIFLIAIYFSSLALCNEGGGKKTCNGVDLSALLNDAQLLRKELEGKEIINFTDVSDIARKYISTDCKLVELIIDLFNASFKLSKTQDSYPFVGTPEDTHLVQYSYLFASKSLKNGWSDFFSPTFQLQIAHDNGRIMFVKAIFIYKHP